MPRLDKCGRLERFKTASGTRQFISRDATNCKPAFGSQERHGKFSAGIFRRVNESKSKIFSEATE
ncbi:MAG: hypothetical protein IKN27_05795 [Selenomonadaceae bacterium]|nr:hypothetical protein [Selenomonadaceae bacterium]